RSGGYGGGFLVLFEEAIPWVAEEVVGAPATGATSGFSGGKSLVMEGIDEFSDEGPEGGVCAKAAVYDPAGGKGDGGGCPEEGAQSAGGDVWVDLGHGPE